MCYLIKLHTIKFTYQSLETTSCKISIRAKLLYSNEKERLTDRSYEGQNRLIEEFRPYKNKNKNKKKQKTSIYKDCPLTLSWACNKLFHQSGDLCPRLTTAMGNLNNIWRGIFSGLCLYKH